MKCLEEIFNIISTVRNYNFYYTTEFVLCLFILHGISVAMLLNLIDLGLSCSLYEFLHHQNGIVFIHQKCNFLCDFMTKTMVITQLAFRHLINVRYNFKYL
jgi:hypothetical protein